MWRADAQPEALHDEAAKSRLKRRVGLEERGPGGTDERDAVEIVFTEGVDDLGGYIGRKGGERVGEVWWFRDGLAAGG